LSERNLSSAVDTTDDSMTSSPSNCCVDVDCVPHSPGYSNNATNSAIVDGCVASCSALTSNQLISASKCLSTTSTDDQCHEDDNDSGYQSGNNTLVASRNITCGLLQPSNVLKHYIDPDSKLTPSSCVDEGFIRVRMNLNKPINMALNSVADFHCSNLADVESFYLPDTVIVIHISSKMTTIEVIQTLLDKYTITDSCNKFVLYEKTTVISEECCGQQYRDSFRRLRHDEYPLELWLHWTEDIDSHQFVLRDNITSDIIWDAFSLPELEAFLNILEREESAYLTKIMHKFISLKTAAIQRVKQMNN